MTDPITVLLVDDELMVRAGLRALLSGSERFVVVGECSRAAEAVDAVARLDPDVVVLDVSMPGGSGLDVVAPVKAASPRSHVLMASQHEGHEFVSRALAAGADGYVSKSSEPGDLLEAVAAIVRGETFLSERVARSLKGRARSAVPVPPDSVLAALTGREREVFEMIAVGKTNKQIAAALGISLGTAKKHRENLQRKIDCHSPAEIARLAIRNGVLDV